MAREMRSSTWQCRSIQAVIPGVGGAEPARELFRDPHGRVRRFRGDQEGAGRTCTGAFLAGDQSSAVWIDL